MQRGLTLKYDTLDNWKDFLKFNSQSPFCKIVGRNGKGKVNPIILAALSPFLKNMLSSLPPYIDGCIILPDFNLEDISVLIDSLTQANGNFMVTQALVTTLGINLDLFNEVTVRNVVKDKSVHKKFTNFCESALANDTESEPVVSNFKYSDYQEILEDTFFTFNDDNKTNILRETKSDKLVNDEIYIIKEKNIPEPKHDNKRINIYNDGFKNNLNTFTNVDHIKKEFSYQTNSIEIKGQNEKANLSKEVRYAKTNFLRSNSTYSDEKTISSDENDIFIIKEDVFPEPKVDDKRKDISYKKFKNNTFKNVVHNDEKTTDDITVDKLYVNQIENSGDKIFSYSESPKIFMCSFCPKTFRTGSSTLEHENTHNGMFDKNENSKVFANNSRKRKSKCKNKIVRRAFDEIRKSEGPKSTESFESLKSEQTLKRFRYNTDVESKIFEKQDGLIFCADEKCGKFFKSLKGAYAHYEGVHIGELVYPCDLCTKRFKSMHIWRCHISVQHNAQKDGSVTCELCGKLFVSKRALRHHKRKIHIDQPRKFVCSHCPKSFKTRGALASHESSHTGANRVTCHVCGKSICSKEALQKHIQNRHEKIQSTETNGFKGNKTRQAIGYKNDLSQVCFKKQGGRFHCKESNCFQSMRNHQIAIAHHEEVHIGLPRYPCDQCEKVLTSRRGWSRHKYRDHIKGTNDTVKCEYCGKDWISEARRKAHITKYHKNVNKS